MDRSEADPTEVIVLVTRSGGFAGVRRSWRAEPVDDDVPVFVELIAECPWDDPEPEERTVLRGRGADRFRWSIEARCGATDERHAELGDADLTGAWRALVDAVRDWGARA